jgi:hypothetical protein
VRTGKGGGEEFAGVRVARTAAEFAKVAGSARGGVLFRRGGGAGGSGCVRRGLSIREIGGGCGVCGGSVLTLLGFRGGRIGAVREVGVTGADAATIGDDGGSMIRFGKGGFLVEVLLAPLRFVGDRDAHDEAAAIKAPFSAKDVGLGGGAGFGLANALAAPCNAGLEVREEVSEVESCEWELPLPLAEGVWPFMGFDVGFSKKTFPVREYSNKLWPESGERRNQGSIIARYARWHS